MDTELERINDNLGKQHPHHGILCGTLKAVIGSSAIKRMVRDAARILVVIVAGSLWQTSILDPPCCGASALIPVLACTRLAVCLRGCKIYIEHGSVICLLMGIRLLNMIASVLFQLFGLFGG